LTSIIIGVVGLIVGGFGFLVMRNPVKLSLLAPGQEGYYQRMVLDRWHRISLRLLGVLVSLFGMVILSAALSSRLKIHVLNTVSEGFLAELGSLFILAWVLGLIIAAVKTVRGELFDWFRFWKQGILLGPIDVYPPVTPAMRKESRLFMMGFCILVVLAIGSAFFRA
jgi:hypothetical protein